MLASINCTGCGKVVGCVETFSTQQSVSASCTNHCMACNYDRCILAVVPTDRSGPGICLDCEVRFGL